MIRRQTEEPEIEVVSGDEYEAPTDQTTFAEDLVIWDTPYQEPSGEPAVVAPAKKSKLLPVLAIVVGLLFLTVAFSLMQSRQAQTNQEPEQTAEATPPPALSELDKLLQQLNTEIDAADPIQAELSFPPVNFELELKDGTVVRQQLQSPSRNF